ncbi:hypothetical protein IV203_009744 [Nitzschia inconspicua]|uniref:Uncharacterized protein n=1 Tax=Nitzschia inconspicua TaxID=303405 RepID=A0A9K3PMF6_9STRA|nr:hypothetical protein IV203_009744 [Nitzschia inconspicua]
MAGKDVFTPLLFGENYPALVATIQASRSPPYRNLYDVSNASETECFSFIKSGLRELPDSCLLIGPTSSGGGIEANRLNHGSDITSEGRLQGWLSCCELKTCGRTIL